MEYLIAEQNCYPFKVFFTKGLSDKKIPNGTRIKIKYGDFEVSCTVTGRFKVPYDSDFANACKIIPMNPNKS